MVRIIVRLLVGALLVTIPGMASITNVHVAGQPTSTQMVLSYTAAGTGSCSVEVSESPSYTPLVFDVDSSYFSGANTDTTRPESLIAGQLRQVVIGKRSAEIALDGKRHSRALQTLTTHYYRITCGADQATGTFVTGNVPLGNTYNDVPFDRNNPGSYAFPSIDWVNKNTTYVDPQSGVLLKRMSGPGEIVPTTVTGLTFSNAYSLGAGWSITGLQAVYSSSSSQSMVYYRATDPAWPGYKTPDSVQIQLTGAFGSAANAADRTINVCLTNNGVTCSGKVVQQVLTQSAGNYTVGDSVPVLDFWRGSLAVSTVDVPSAREDMRVQLAAVSVGADGLTVTRQSGDLFNLKLAAGSRVTLDGTDCAVANVSNENTLTLATAFCVSAGAHNYQGRNWGVLINKASASTDSITIGGATWTLSTSGYVSMGATGGFDLCSPTTTTGPTGPGNLCIGSSLVADYLSAIPMYWLGEDGTANLVGTGSVGNRLCLTGGSWAWDPQVSGRFWCLTANALSRVDYTGNSTPTTITLDGGLTPVTVTPVAPDITAMVKAFNPAYQPFQCLYGWQLIGQSGTNVVLACAQTTQNSPTWIAAFSTQTNQIIAATSTYGGSAGAPNRWAVAHTIFTTGATDWILVSAGGPGDNPYQVPITSGTVTPSYSVCPPNAIDATVTGQTLCTTVTVGSLVPASPVDGSTLYGQGLLPGDYFEVMALSGASWYAAGEQVRVLAVNGLVLTLQRAVRSYAYGLNNNHAGQTLALQVVPGASEELWWNYADDPLGQTLTKAYGKTMLEDPSTFDCHQVYDIGIFLAGCLKFNQKPGIAERVGLLPSAGNPFNSFNNPTVASNTDAGFGKDQYRMTDNLLESHPSRSQYNASALDRLTSFDARPYLGDAAIATPSAVQQVPGSTFLYRISAAVTTPIQPRLRPVLMTSGVLPLVDVSPAVLNDTAADNYKGCYVINPGDCRAGSVAGEVYVNVKYAAQASCFPSRFAVTPGLTDICVTPNGDSAHHVIQGSVIIDDNNGALVRRLTTAFSPYKSENTFWNVRATPDAKWVFWLTTGLGRARNELMMLKLPPYPDVESVNRGDFVPVQVSLGAASGYPNARVRFGYAENGSPQSLYCTPRQVACTTSTNGSVPFVWADEAQTVQTCSTGCKITIPALAGRVLYYVPERQDGLGNWVGGPVQTMTVR